MHLYVGHGIEMVLWSMAVCAELKAAYLHTEGYLWPQLEGAWTDTEALRGACTATTALRNVWAVALVLFSSRGSRTGNCDTQEHYIQHYTVSSHSTTATSTYYTDFT
ncbi:hypothetical protein QQF64_023117 [Cirrhinus molitorella]|uniref:Secreted protein n=1 Tax=Cirrhinus molitorella TaxID=172907 RepID=A0ABR3L6K8_9TELE